MARLQLTFVNVHSQSSVTHIYSLLDTVYILHSEERTARDGREILG